MIKTVLADDHHVVVAGLQRYLTELGGFDVCGVADSRERLFELLSESVPDVLVLDLNMPGMSGARTVREITDAFPQLPVLVFSMQPEDQYALSVVRAGARGYLTKSRHLSELAEAIRRVSAGGHYITDELATRLLGTNPAARGELHATLSAREREVLERIARGTSVHRIAEELDISVSTVRSYVERVRTKLGVGSLQELVIYAFREGLAG